MSDLAKLDAMAQAELVQRGELTADELYAACLDRIDALNPLLRCVVTVSRDAPPASAAPKNAPLAGVPFLVKDSTPWPGLRWSMGSRLFAHNVASQQTPFGRALTAAGLVCVGKTATSELGLLGSTETLLEGITHNPWDLSRSATGSSGGSAVAVAAGIVPIAHASDGGGSIRIPAAACGLFGFKPSRGRTLSASFGTSDFLDMTSEHCVTRSVRDSALFASLTADTSVDEAAAQMVREPSKRRLRIAAWTTTLMGEQAAPDVLAAHERTVALLRELGHTVDAVPAPAYDGAALGEAFFLVAGAAIADVVTMVDNMRGAPVQSRELEPFTWALIDAFRATPNALATSRRAFAEATLMHREATQAYDALLTPVLATDVWPLGHLSPVLGRDELIARTARAVGYTPMQNIAGQPAMSVPLHTLPSGMPCGAHFSAAAGNDALLFALAYELEQAAPWTGRWPRHNALA